MLDEYVLHQDHLGNRGDHTTARRGIIRFADVDGFQYLLACRKCRPHRITVYLKMSAN